MRTFTGVAASLAWWAWLCLSLLQQGAVAKESSSTPPISAKIASSWPAPTLLVQYLESLSIEKPSALLPFLNFLTTNPTYAVRQPLASSEFRTARDLTGQVVSAKWNSINPLLTPFLHPNETFELLENRMDKSLVLRGRGERESLRLALATRESSVITEGMRSVWESRQLELSEDLNHTLAMNGDCESWVDIAGGRACNEAQFWKAVGGKGQRMGNAPLNIANNNESPLFPFDHLMPPGGRNVSLPLVIFYACPVSPSFQTFFNFLTSLAGGAISTKGTSKIENARLQYALRWKPVTGTKDYGPEDKTVKQSDGVTVENLLSGWGASLDIKKSDYLAIDDRLQGPASDVTDSLKQQITLGESLKMVPVRKVDLPELSLRTAQHILDARSQNASIDTFVSVTSSFPLIASQLSQIVPSLSKALVDEIKSNQMTFPIATRTSFSINGVSLTEDQVHPFSLLRIMRKERELVNKLHKLDKNFATKEVRDLIMFPGLSKIAANSGSDGGTGSGVGPDGMLSIDALGELFDASDRPEGKGKVITWWNDLENDRRYNTWSKSVKDFLKPVYPGSMNLIARNINQVIFVMDLSQIESLTLITESIKQFVMRGIPVRFGVVSTVGIAEEQDLDVSTKTAKVIWYLTDAIGRASTMNFIAELALTNTDDGQITEASLQELYNRLTSKGIEHQAGGSLAHYDMLQHDTSLLTKTAATRAYMKRLGISAPSVDSEEDEKVPGSFFLDGAHFFIDDDFTQNLQRTLGLHIQYVQQEVYLKHIADSQRNLDTLFYDLPTTYPRRNSYIFPSVDNASGGKPLTMVDMTEVISGLNLAWSQLAYIEGADEPDQPQGDDIPVTSVIYLITDLDSHAGRQLVRNALKMIDRSPETMLFLTHNPTTYELNPHPFVLSRLIYNLQRTEGLGEMLPVELIAWLDLQLTADGPDKNIGKSWSAENPIKAFLSEEVCMADDDDQMKIFWQAAMNFANKVGVAPGENAFVINGRVVGPFPNGIFESADMKVLLKYEQEKRILPIIHAINSTTFDFASLNRFEQAQFLQFAGSVVTKAFQPDPTAGLFSTGFVDRKREYLLLSNKESAIIDEKEETGIFEIAVVVDPATELAQRWAPIIKSLSKLASVHLRLYLNPARYTPDLPIKRFYQYTFSTEVAFNSETGAEVQPQLRFEGLPEDVLLTFAADTHKSWLAFPKICPYDLDNIRLADLPRSAQISGVEAEFELESIIVEGHARDMPSSSPPRGLQLELTRSGLSNTSASIADTIVMSNLGYFQFKANPGPWQLGVRPGKSAEVFTMESAGAEGWKSAELATTGDQLVVSTLEGLTIYPRFRRNKGQERTELLEDTEATVALKQAKLVDRLKNLMPFWSPPAKDNAAHSHWPLSGKKADINIFTVASGLLYERMAFIMMTSVMKHTKSTVKFWFIQNFLSPSFRAFIPHMAKEYGFEYELVTYKWPHWLRAQKEKQRTIWGYKILFLDVLFPLELSRVIFVDSDQIVRTDLQQLIDLDLNGAPYAYAPMGDDREEMEGFRFWKTGYWKEHLRDKPYHISALYVVDLDRFRQVAAGDRLRQMYQGLSADPNSLANLDQDLPNNMQSAIPIFTLDKSWLWCETWCSDESLAEAKTIDLCNNPLTHEPKLARAKRLIPEWTVYDDEVAALAKRVAAQESSTAAMGTDAFSQKADELQQAMQQKVERDEFVQEKGEQVQGKQSGTTVVPVEAPPHVKDEL